ncbi:MAG: GPW/gp25 family protein [Flavobacteriales bacterium]|nr:GPW/gp25 family protein [Flavobacteriales bacterium]
MGNSTTNNQNFLGSGWAFPITFSSGNLELKLTQFEENIRDSIDVILKTNLGERCLEPQFGTPLKQFFFKVMNQSLKGEIIDVIKFSLLEHEPRISVKEVTANYDSDQPGTVLVSIEYVYIKTNTRHNYVFPFYIKEATNLATL